MAKANDFSVARKKTDEVVKSIGLVVSGVKVLNKKYIKSHYATVWVNTLF